MSRRHCPLCWTQVERTIHDCIEGHWDTALNPCRVSGEPYRITLAAPPMRRKKAA
jgi:hypothetical protein